MQCACDIDDSYFRFLKSNVVIDFQEYATFGKVYFNFFDRFCQHSSYAN